MAVIMEEPWLTEVRIHGRGGQGNVRAAYMLAQAGFEDGRFAQAFPSFGPERRGAPVAAYVRIADRPIRRRCQVLHPAFLIIQDDGLLHAPGTTEGLLPDGAVLINSAKKATDLALPPGRAAITLPATAIANEILGKPIPNSALIAVFITLSGLLTLEALEKALAHQFTGTMLERNVRLVREVASRVPAGAWKERPHAPGD